MEYGATSFNPRWMLNKIPEKLFSNNFKSHPWEEKNTVGACSCNKSQEKVILPEFIA